MGKNKDKHDGAPPIEDGFTEQATMGELTGEWVTPEPGMALRGHLERAFIFTSDNGTTAAYKGNGTVTRLDGSPVMGADGQPLTEWLVSEKAVFADAIRALPLGTTVKLTFLAKEDMLIADKKNPGVKKKSGKTIWRVQLLAKKDGKGILCREALNRAAATAKSRAQLANATAGGGEDLPF